MYQSSTLYVGREVHKASMAVAYVAQEHHAEVISLGAIDPRPCASAQLIWKKQSNSHHLVFVDAAGP
jgi:hypothetical protein